MLEDVILILLRDLKSKHNQKEVESVYYIKVQAKIVLNEMNFILYKNKFQIDPSIKNVRTSSFLCI